MMMMMMISATDGSDRAPLTAAQTPFVLKTSSPFCGKRRKEKCFALESSTCTTTTAVMSLNGANLTLLPVCVCILSAQWRVNQLWIAIIALSPW